MLLLLRLRCFVGFAGGIRLLRVVAVGAVLGFATCWRGVVGGIDWSLYCRPFVAPVGCLERNETGKDTRSLPYVPMIDRLFHSVNEIAAATTLDATFVISGSAVLYPNALRIYLLRLAILSSDSSNPASGNVAKWLLRLTRMVPHLQLSNPFGGAGSSPAVVECSFAFACQVSS